jgi:ferric-dicitrate binding protein FerR (iron transport regulator)
MKEETVQSQDEMDGMLLLRYVRGISTEAEKARIMQWAGEHPDNEKTLIQVAQLYDAWQTNERMQRRNPFAAFYKTLERNKRKVRRVFLRKISVAAACVALAVSLAVNYHLLSPREMEPSFITVQTHAGMRTSLNLPDGTAVHLNSAGTLTYPVAFGSKERRVTLDGEGYFQVARDVKRPFIVCTEGRRMEVEALGTAFNVQAYASDSLLKTTLLEGAVRLGIQSESGVWKHAVLKPSEKAVYNLTAKKLHISQTNSAHDTAWIQGRLIFKNLPLPEVLMRLSHFYDVTFDVKDAVINNYTFTGTFENRQLSQVLDYLSISSRIGYQIIPSTGDDSRGVKRTKVVLRKKGNRMSNSKTALPMEKNGE